MRIESQRIQCFNLNHLLKRHAAWYFCELFYHGQTCSWISPRLLYSSVLQNSADCMRILCAPGLPVPPWWSIQSTFGTNQVLPSRRPTEIMLRLLTEPEAAAWAKLDSLPLPGKGGRILPSTAPLFPSPGYVHLLMWQTRWVSKPVENHLLTKKALFLENSTFEGWSPWCSHLKKRIHGSSAIPVKP